jgi:hypothetical protein
MGTRWKTVRVGFTLSVAAVILTLAIPRTIGAFTLLPFAQVKETLARKHSVSFEELSRLRAAQENSLRWHQSARVQRELAETELALANSVEDASERERWYLIIQATLEKSLLEAPSDPRAWTLLTGLMLHAKEGGDGARAALGLSLMTGQYEKALLMPRVRDGIILWDRLSADERSMVKDQVRLAYRYDNRDLIELSKKGRKPMSVVVGAMAEGSLANFERFIRALNKN